MRPPNLLLVTIMPTSLASLSDAIFDLTLSKRTSMVFRKKALVFLARMVRKDPTKYGLNKIFASLWEIFENNNFISLN